MNIFSTIAILLTLSACIGYVNFRFIKLPSTIGLMLGSIIVSLMLVLSGHLGLGIEKQLIIMLQVFDLNKTLMVGMLSFLLFAGALQVDFRELVRRKWEVTIYATIGVFISTAFVGTFSYYALAVLGIRLDLIYCLLFGALISPTDPIAVIGMLRSAKIPKSLEVQIAGESLFNDGIGVVLFVVLLDMTAGSNHVPAGAVLLLFVKETIGGAILGLLLGWITFKMLKTVDNYELEILMTLSLVTGGYALASAIGTSGPIAIVVAGLLIGSHGRQFAMSEKTRLNLDMFWELVDVILNSVLFVLIGLELLVIRFSAIYLIASALSIPIIVLARFASIGVPMLIMTVRKGFRLKVLKIMTWGGLRGGIAVALSLSLPTGLERDVIIVMTYCIVVFSVIVQGLSFKYGLESQDDL